MPRYFKVNVGRSAFYYLLVLIIYKLELWTPSNGGQWSLLAVLANLVGTKEQKGIKIWKHEVDRSKRSFLINLNPGDRVIAHEDRWVILNLVHWGLGTKISFFGYKRCFSLV